MSDITLEKSTTWIERVCNPVNTLLTAALLIMGLVGSYATFAVRQSGTEMRVGTLEKKSDFFETMIAKRNAEREEVITRLTRVETQQTTLLEQQKIVIELLKERHR